ncbi:MAG: BMC domain-containing protein [Rhodoferax sp.]|nr:BMC domain-containing protein [Rhodoferax sp.]MDP3654849.1 BMC domain-containing protein [Rhodoferax sp.]
MDTKTFAPKERFIQEFVPGKQITLAHAIANPTAELCKKIGVPGAEAIGIMTLTPGETAMIAGDIATKTANVEIGFLDRFSGALVISGSVASVEEALRQVIEVLRRQLGYSTCDMTRT